MLDPFGGVVHAPNPEEEDAVKKEAEEKLQTAKQVAIHAATEAEALAKDVVEEITGTAHKVIGDGERAAEHLAGEAGLLAEKAAVETKETLGATLKSAGDALEHSAY